jgi:hypothetical protein
LVGVGKAAVLQFLCGDDLGDLRGYCGHFEGGFGERWNFEV